MSVCVGRSALPEGGRGWLALCADYYTVNLSVIQSRGILIYAQDLAH